MPGKKLGVGIIGLGIISDAHERGFVESADKADILAMCDINQEKAYIRAQKHGAMVFSDYHKILEDPRIDLVDIILPHNLHYAVARDAIEAGKHTLIEKPLTLRSKDGADLIERAKKAKVVFSVAENSRFVTAYQEVEKLLQTGVLGRILSIRTLIAGSEIDRLVDQSTWKGKKEGSGGGVIMDAAPHTFYLLKWLFGEIESLQAFQDQLISESEVEDNALIVGRLKNGALFNAQFSFTTQTPWTERLEINGMDASVVIDQIANPVGTYYCGTQDYSGKPIPGIPYNPERWKFDSIVSEVKEFVNAIVEGRQAWVDPADANYAVNIVEKAYESIHLNKSIRLI